MNKETAMIKIQRTFPEQDYSKGWEVADKQQKGYQAILDKQDADAKASGTLVGRMIREQIADGFAVYVILKENKTTVRVGVVSGIDDDWVIPNIGREGSLSKDYVINKLESEEALSKLFS